MGIVIGVALLVVLGVFVIAFLAGSLGQHRQRSARASSDGDGSPFLSHSLAAGGSPGSGARHFPDSDNNAAANDGGNASSGDGGGGDGGGGGGGD